MEEPPSWLLGLTTSLTAAVQVQVVDISRADACVRGLASCLRSKIGVGFSYVNLAWSLNQGGWKDLRRVQKQAGC